MISDREIADLLADPTKRIDGDIVWIPSGTHRGAWEFTAPVQSATGWPLRIEAGWNPRAPKLSLTLVHDEAGRVAGLCLGLGSVHHRPTCGRTRATKDRCDCPRGMHMHRWTEQFGDQWIYVPSGITAQADDPATAWQQFCTEINLAHRGTLHLAERGARW